MVLIIFKLKEVSGLTPACKEEKRLMREWTNITYTTNWSEFRKEKFKNLRRKYIKIQRQCISV